MSDVVIQCEGLGKSYLIGHEGPRERYTALRDVLASRARHLWNRTRQAMRGQSSVAGDEIEEFWALRDVSFEVNRGEAVGIIGRNGAGKSTLLKILSRITEPTEGCVTLRGRVASLLEVGTGFHPELSGRENIFLNGAILGMTRAEIKRRFDEIVAFAEVEKFLDTPVKRYSSGMYVRLAFAVAAHLEPEILVVDEVLAVGDAEFQKKCIGKMHAVAEGGRTVLFVSHNMAAVRSLCPKSMWFIDGQIADFGSSDVIIQQYLVRNDSAGEEIRWPHGLANRGENQFCFTGARILDRQLKPACSIGLEEAFYVEISYRIKSPLPLCRIGFFVQTDEGVTVMEAHDADEEEFRGSRAIGDAVVRYDFPSHVLNTGKYYLTLNAGLPGIRNLSYAESVLAFEVNDTGSRYRFQSVNRKGFLQSPGSWERVDSRPLVKT